MVAAEFALAKTSSGKITDLKQVDLLPNATENKNDKIVSKINPYRNDVTPYSLGLLTDVRRGGLKQDLSSVFEMSTATAVTLPPEFTGTAAAPKKLYQSTLGTPSSGLSDPAWTTLAGYYNSFRNITTPDDTPTLVLPATANSLTADLTPKTYFPGPVIAKVETVFSLVTREAGSSYLGQYGPFSELAKFDDTVNLIVTPQITLHNPYNVSISFHKMVVTIINIPVAFRFTLEGQQQSVIPTHFESMNEMVQNQPDRGEKKFIINLANWKDPLPANTANTDISGPIVMKPGQTLLCTPYLDPQGNFLKDSRSGSKNDIFDWENKITAKGIKAKPGFTPGLGFENNSNNPSCRSSSTVLGGGSSNWWMLMIRDPARPRPPANVSWDIPPSPNHPTDKYFVEYQAQRPGWWPGTPGSGTKTLAPATFQVTATLQSTAASNAINYAQLKFDYTNDDNKLKAFFNNRIYRCPADPTQYLTGVETFVSATTSISNQAKVLPFAVFSAYARTTNGGVYETGNRTKSGPDSPQTNLLKDGRLAGKPFLFHNPSRAVVTMDLATDKPPGIQPYETNLQPFRSRGDYQDYMDVSEDPVTKVVRVPALTANTTARGIKSGSYLEIPTGPMQTLADFRRSNALTSSYLPHFVQPVGNSLLHPLMSASQVIESNAAISATALLDHSVLANHAFYDRFYFSTFATRGTDKPDTVFEQFMNGTAPLATQSFQPYLPAGTTAATAKADLFASGKPKATAYQMVQGPFNVNSTSVQAWKAVLASMNKSEVATLWAKLGKFDKAKDIVTSKGIPIFAMSLLNGGLTSVPLDATKIDDTKTNDWNGYRELSDAQLTTLATEIVKQVRLRGPFLSMSEFVNRQIGTESDLTLTGALEKAIADSKINEGFMNMNKPDPKVTELTASDFSDTTLYNYKTLAATLGNPAAGAPGWISQGDLLRILEPAATVRSDTFVIRVCGEAQDASGKVTARAFAEAVVQRVPEYVDPVDRPSLNAYDITVPAAVPTTAAVANKTFGRRINVVSFRWLTSNEI